MKINFDRPHENDLSVVNAYIYVAWPITHHLIVSLIAIKLHLLSQNGNTEFYNII